MIIYIYVCIYILTGYILKNDLSWQSICAQINDVKWKIWTLKPPVNFYKWHQDWTRSTLKMNWSWKCPIKNFIQYSFLSKKMNVLHIRKSQALRRRHAIHSWINVEGRWTRNLEGDGSCSLNQSHRSCFLKNNNNNNSSNNNNVYIYIIYIYHIYISYIYIIYIYHIYICVYIYIIYIYHMYIYIYIIYIWYLYMIYIYIYIYYIMLCYVILYYVMLYYTISYYNIILYIIKCLLSLLNILISCVDLYQYQYLYSICEYMYDIFMCVCAILHVGRWYDLAITITLAHTPSRIDVDGRGEHAITQAVGVFHVHLGMGLCFQVRPEQVEQKHLVENYHDLHGEKMGKWQSKHLKLHFQHGEWQGSS